MASVTVPGPDKSVVSIPISSGVGSDIVALLASMISTNVFVTSYTGGTIPAPSPNVAGNELLVTGSGGLSTSVPSGYNFIVNMGAAPDSLSASNSAILSGTTGGAFWVSGQSTVAASGGNNTIVGQVGGTYMLATDGGNDRIYNDGGGTIAGGGGSNFLWANNAADTLSNLIISNGTNDTIVAGPGADTIAVYGADALIFGGSGALVIGAGNGATISSGTGPETIFGGANDLLFGNQSSSILFVGGAGSSTVVGGQNAVTTIFGSNGADITFASASTYGAVMVGGPGNETLNASSSTANDTLAAGSGPESMVGGSGNNLFWAGPGGDTMTGGAGANSFNFVLGSAGSHYFIEDFTSNDIVNLIGYGSSASANALAGATTTNGSSIISLSDNTQITFLNVVSLTSSQIQSS